MLLSCTPINSDYVMFGIWEGAGRNDTFPLCACTLSSNWTPVPVQEIRWLL